MYDAQNVFSFIPPIAFDAERLKIPNPAQDIYDLSPEKRENIAAALDGIAAKLRKANEEEAALQANDAARDWLKAAIDSANKAWGEIEAAINQLPRDASAVAQLYEIKADLDVTISDAKLTLRLI